jgi:Family of unknown function (DUF5681)
MAEEKIGYRRPPSHSRWRKGRSGNPTGRPKSAGNFADDLIAELSEMIRITEGAKVRRITKRRALVKSLTSASLKGNARAASLLISLSARVIEADPHGQAQAELSARDRKVVEDYLERQVQLRLAKERGSE